MTVTISADDPRTIRAIELTAEADYWLSGRNRRGEEVYGVPSQSEADRYYIVTRSSCDCADFRNGVDAQRACKHMLAVQLYTELVTAQRRVAQPVRRRHLSVVP